jgi:hypothetical protein
MSDDNHQTQTAILDQKDDIIRGEREARDM